jgi:hypothetical protein
MFKCNDGKMNPTAKKCIDNYTMQSKFREVYPEKGKAIQGMTIPSCYCNSMESMVAFADEKIRNKKERENKY